jgi:SAM-dependent methyltransferase
MRLNPFDQLYRGVPPWEIGAPQPAFVELQTQGTLKGSVLDIGCGSGENAIYLASQGHDVWGIDAAGRAIAMARKKAELRNVPVRFEMGDALHLEGVGRTFDTIIDCGLFHTFSDAGRRLYVDGLTHVARPGTTLFLLCFSDEEPNWGGPRRVGQSDIRASFGAPWAVERIDASRFSSRLSSAGSHAWLAQVVFVGRPLSRGN